MSLTTPTLSPRNNRPGWGRGVLESGRAHVEDAPDPQPPVLGPAVRLLVRQNLVVSEPLEDVPSPIPLPPRQWRRSRVVDGEGRRQTSGGRVDPRHGERDRSGDGPSGPGATSRRKSRMVQPAQVVPLPLPLLGALQPQALSLPEVHLQVQHERWPLVVHHSPGEPWVLMRREPPVKRGILSPSPLSPDAGVKTSEKEERNHEGSSERVPVVYRGSLLGNVGLDRSGESSFPDFKIDPATRGRLQGLPTPSPRTR